MPRFRFIDEGTFRESSGRGYQNDTLTREQSGDGIRKENFAGGSNRVVEEDDFMTQESNLPGGGSSSGTGKIYTKEELKKITVDIYRPIPQDSMTTKRANFDPKVSFQVPLHLSFLSWHLFVTRYSSGLCYCFVSRTL